MCNCKHETEEIVKQTIEAAMEAFAHKEIASSKLNRQIDSKLETLTNKFDSLDTKVDTHHIQQTAHQKTNEAHQVKTEEMLQAWANAQGFMKVIKWVLGVLLGLGMFMQVLKQFGIKILWV